MYPWLTGAGSWLILTLLTQVFGAEGEYGNLTLHPQLLAEQFDREGNARIAFSFAGRKMNLIYQNPKHLEVGDYEVVEICLDGRPLPFDKKNPVVPGKHCCGFLVTPYILCESRWNDTVF